MLLLRAHVLALGFSGVRPEVVDLMVEMLNRDVIPVVPEQGSLGASGDLAPLANLALPLIGHGEVLGADGRPESATDAFAREGLSALRLEAKEGLAPRSTARRGCCPSDPRGRPPARLARTADVVAAMTIEAALGTDAPFDERLQRLRPHPGQAVSAANLRTLLAGSPILARDPVVGGAGGPREHGHDGGPSRARDRRQRGDGAGARGPRGRAGARPAVAPGAGRRHARGARCDPRARELLRGRPRVQPRHRCRRRPRALGELCAAAETAAGSLN